MRSGSAPAAFCISTTIGAVPVPFRVNESLIGGTW